MFSSSQNLTAVFKKPSHIKPYLLTATLDFFKQVKTQRKKIANTSIPTVANRLDADTTYRHASGLLLELQHTLLDRCASQHHILSPTQEHALDLQLGWRVINTPDDSRKENIDSVKHSILYHCIAFFPLSPSIRCFVYKKPEVKFNAQL